MDVLAVLGPWWGSNGGGFGDGGGGEGGGVEGGGPKPLFWSLYGNFSIIVVFLGTYNTVFFLYGSLM
jgi:hypothetical protein